EDHFEVFGEVAELIVCHRDETHVLVPGCVVYFADLLCFIGEVFLSHGAYGDLLLPEAAEEAFFELHGTVAHLVHGKVPGEEVNLLAEGYGLDQGGIIGFIVHHHGHGGFVEAIDQQAAGLVGGWVDGANDGGGALFAEPFFGGIEQGGGYFWIIDGLKE